MRNEEERREKRKRRRRGFFMEGKEAGSASSGVGKLGVQAACFVDFRA